MKKILLACALEREIKDLRQFYNEHKDNFSYEAAFLVMGYGRSNAVKTLIKTLMKNKYDLLINIGTCGVKVKNGQKNYPIGKLIEPSEIYDGDFCLENEFRKISLTTNKFADNLPLVTISSFGRYDSYMNTSYIEDMEGYEIANVCLSFNQPFKIIKVISNHITDNPENDLTEFYENCEKVMHSNTENIFTKLHINKNVFANI